MNDKSEFDEGDGEYVVAYVWRNHNFALGMFIFLKPDLVWKLTEEWKSYRADEPSEFYLKVAKIGGISFALFGIIMITLPFILE
ncbi:MAG: DUF6199 family natural product biosynthesis protein [Christensenellales bacterium]